MTTGSQFGPAFLPVAIRSQELIPDIGLSTDIALPKYVRCFEARLTLKSQPASSESKFVSPRVQNGK
jgi:hypothetical protein